MISQTKQELNKRMLRLMEYYLNEHPGLTETAYLKSIGFSRTNIGNIRENVQAFTLDHVKAACELTGANANWLLAIHGSTMNRKEINKSPLEKIKDAVVELEALLNKSSGRKNR